MLKNLFLTVVIAATIGACNQHADATPNPPPSPSASPLLATCMDQAAWEPHEGAFTGHWEAAEQAIASHDGPTGSSEVRLAAAELRAMAALAAGPDPNVAHHLGDAALALDRAAIAFDAAAFPVAKTNLSDAASEHEVALGSTSEKDWC